MQTAVQVQRAYAEKHTATLMGRIQAGKFPPANKLGARRLVEWQQARGHKANTILKNLYCFEKFLIALGDTELEKVTKDDVTRAFALIERQKMSAESKRQIRVVVKSFYKHFYGNDEYTPPVVGKWLTTTIKESEMLLPSDMVSFEECVKLIEACKNRRDKAIISLLWERGLRASELLGMQVCDVNLRERPPYIMVRLSKTKPRRIPITFSAGYIAEYMLEEAVKVQPYDGSLWLQQNDKTHRGFIRRSTLLYAALNVMLKGIGQRAGIRKRGNLHAHLFRHSAATRMASEMSESVLREIMGWSKRSNMTARYTHLSGKTVDKEVLKMDGLEIEEHEARVQVKICQQCRFPNLLGAYHCVECNKAFEAPKNVNDIMRDKTLVRQVLAKAISNPELFNEIYREMQG